MHNPVQDLGLLIHQCTPVVLAGQHFPLVQRSGRRPLRPVRLTRPARGAWVETIGESLRSGWAHCSAWSAAMSRPAL